MFYFQLLGLDHCHARIFSSAVVSVWRDLCFRGLNNLCAALRIILEARGTRAKRVGLERRRVTSMDGVILIALADLPGA